MAILIGEILGFSLVILMLWFDEIFDLPHVLFGAAATPINWVESVIETVFVTILCWFVISRSTRSLRRIRYLEGFLPVCSFCNRIQLDGAWIPIDQYLSQHTGLRISHGLCPECELERYG